MSLSFDLRFSLGGRPMHARLTTRVARVALVGPSGVGKSSLLRALAGTLEGARGAITVRGARFADERGLLVPAERRRLGWVPQDARLFPHLTVRENVAFAARGSCDALVVAFGIEPLLSRMPRGLSGGERQRVALVRALATQPELILLDEPLSALDREARAEVAVHIERTRASLDAQLVLVSHDETDVLALADEVYVLGATGELARR